MTAINFPDTPTDGQEFTAGDRTWSWNNTTQVWDAVSGGALPSQSGQAGKYLTTDGTSASWSTITTDPTPQVFLMMGA
jgi:hypothetical protein